MSPYPVTLYRPGGGPIIAENSNEEARAFRFGYRRQPCGKYGEPPVLASAVLPHEHQEYPKWVNGRIAHNVEEERALTGAETHPVEAPAKAAEPRLPVTPGKASPETGRGRIAGAQVWLRARLARGPVSAGAAQGRGQALRLADHPGGGDTDGSDTLEGRDAGGLDLALAECA
jgi:hypothetical protein